MNQGLFTAHGAQPVQPSRYKPIWTDRFFTGYFTNRSPFRSPLSVYYADGWNLGRTDTLYQGTNVEVSPRLTLARRPGSTVCSTFGATSPLGFYSFHQATGAISLYYDNASSVYRWTPTSDTSIYTKTHGAGQTSYLGIGNQLYMADGTVPQAYDTIAGTTRPTGLAAPSVTPKAVALDTHGVGGHFSMSELTGAYITTAVAVANYTTVCEELWISTTSNNIPVLSFESSSTGTSGTIYNFISIDANGYLVYNVWDSVTSTFSTQNSLTTVNDGELHLITTGYVYQPTASQATSLVNGAPLGTTSAGTQNSNPDPVVASSFSYTTNQTTSSSSTPAQFQMFVWVDGIPVIQVFPQVTPAVGNGYWRIGQSSAMGGTYLGYIGEVNIHTQLGAGMFERWQSSTLYNTNQSSGTAQNGYETAIESQLTGIEFWWKINPDAGGVSVESISGNNGTYQGAGVSYNQNVNVQWVPYAATTAYTVGQIVLDTNGDAEKCTVAGTSGGTVPTWASVGNSTTDGSVTWFNLGPACVRTTIGRQYCYCYVNEYGHYSTASALSSPIGIDTNNQIIQVTVQSSPLSTVTQIALFRTVDGGSTLFYVNSIPNNGEQFNIMPFNDGVPDVDLNILLAAPIAHANDQPAFGMTALAYHLGRVWGAVGNVLYASGGPDTLVGNGSEAFPPANSWNYPSQIIKLISHATGLLVLTTSGIWIHAGGPAITQFYPQPLYSKIGISSYNAADIRGNEVAIFTTDRVAFMLDLASNTINDIGYPIADQLINFSPANTYVVFHRKGQDNALYYADGQTGWFRCVSQQPPDYSITGPVWSPKADIIFNVSTPVSSASYYTSPMTNPNPPQAGTAGAIASLETSPGVWNLIIGPYNSTYSLYQRDPSIFADGGTAYEANFVLGSVVLAQPGELAELGFITADFIRTGTSPKIYVLFDEINGPLTSYGDISGFVISDPPILYGASGSPSTLYSNRYYFKQTDVRTGNPPQPAFCRSMCIFVDYATDTVQNEALTTTIFGSIKVENG